MTDLRRKKLRSAAIWMLVLGTFVILAGVSTLRAWPEVAWPTRTAYGVSLGAGVVVCLSAVWLLAAGSVTRPAVAYAAASAGLLLALNQGLGLWFGTLLCYTPG